MLMCAGSSATIQGSCKGDSGGPLVIFNTPNYRYIQVGVVVGGLIQDCGSKESRHHPGIYTRLDHPEIMNFLEAKLPQLGKKLLRKKYTLTLFLRPSSH